MQLDAAATTKERWRVIPGFEGRYYVSDQGRVWTALRNRLLIPTIQLGYLSVGLRDGKRQRRFQVHTLVLIAFRGPRRRKNVGRHLNGSRLDNRLDNLAWGTQQQNVLDTLSARCGRPVGVKAEPSSRRILSPAEIEEIRHARSLGTTYRTLAERYGSSPSVVYRTLHRALREGNRAYN